MRMPLVWIERQLAAVIRPAHRTVGAKGKGPPESPPTALFGFGSPGRTRTSDQSVTPVPPFPTGVDYLIAVGRMARSEEHTSELQSRLHLVCRLLLEKKNSKQT